jgi:hypothetical protein
MSALTALRQACCHPHLVRHNEEGHWRAHQPRLSMQQIMTRLVNKAYADLDTAVAAWMAARLQRAAAHLFLKTSSTASETIADVLKEVRTNVEFVRGACSRLQARARGRAGEIKQDLLIQQQQQQQQPKGHVLAKTSSEQRLEHPSSSSVVATALESNAAVAPEATPRCSGVCFREFKDVGLFILFILFLVFCDGATSNLSEMPLVIIMATGFKMMKLPRMRQRKLPRLRQRKLPRIDGGDGNI